MLRFLLLSVFALILINVTHAQDPAVEQVQAVVKGPLTGHSARVLTDHLVKRPGVLLCRIDPASRNLLLRVDQHFHLSEAGLRKFFAMHGMPLACYTRGPITDTPFHLLDPRACGPDVDRK